MAGELDISTINIISPNGLVTKPLTVDNYGYAKLGDERVGVTPTNWIINGMFDVWQRGTSQTSSGYWSDDRFANVNATSTKTHSKQVFPYGQTDVPNNPTNFSRTEVVTGATSSSYVVKYQRIEDIIKLAGKTVTLSFWAKANSSKVMAIGIWQNFGTGGSSNLYFSPSKFSLTTNWQRITKTVTIPSISGKTVGSNSYYELQFWFDAGSDFNSYTDSLGNQSGTFDIANVCLVEGSVPVECPNEPYAEVLRKCQRYCWKNYYGFGTYNAYGLATSISTSVGFAFINHPVEMRTNIKSITFNGLAVNDGLATFPITGLTLVNGSNLTSQLYFSGATGLTAYRTYFLSNNNNTTGYLLLECEL